MPEPLVVVGAGGFGREAIDVANAMLTPDGKPQWDVVGVADDSPSEVNLKRLAERDITYLGTTQDVLTSELDACYVVGIGLPAARRRLAALFDQSGWVAATLLHPAATLGSQVALGAGTVVCAGARITTNIRLGRHVHVNPNATIGHDTVIGDFVSLNPSVSISGDCVIHDEVLVGVQGVVLNQMTIGARSVVGACACVTRSVPQASVVKGVPAR